MSKNIDETVRFQSEKRQKWIRETRRERLQGIAEGALSPSGQLISRVVTRKKQMSGEPIVV